MKQFKKIMALAMIAVLTLCMCVNAGVCAFAAPEDPAEESQNPGSITINGTTAGKVYRVYKIFDMTMVAGTEGDTAKVAYTIAEDWKAFFTGEGAGAKYLVDSTEDNKNLPQIVIDGENEEGNAIKVPKRINITEANVADFTQEALEYAAAKTATAEAIAGGEQTEVSKLPLGYYLVYPVGATGLAAGSTSICSLTSTTPNATVEMKATYPPFNKTTDVNIEDPHAIGESIPFQLTSTVPDMTGYTEYFFQFRDKMNAGFSFDDNITVKIDEDVIDEKYYEITKNEIANGFELKIDVFGLVQENIVEPGKEVRVNYSATITEAALEMVAENEAKLVYSNDPSDTTSKGETVEVKVRVYTATILVNKVDGNNTVKVLPGATFVLKNEAGQFYKYTKAIDDTDAAVTWVDEEQADKLTTDNEGIAKFNGLGEGTYFLKEIAAPEGYNLLTDERRVEIKASVSEEGEEVTVPAPITLSVTVENLTGTTLPATGGIGTTIFYIVGGLLVAGAVVLLVTKKRMSAGK